MIQTLCLLCHGQAPLHTLSLHTHSSQTIRGPQCCLDWHCYGFRVQLEVVWLLSACCFVGIRDLLSIPAHVLLNVADETMKQNEPCFKELVSIILIKMEVGEKTTAPQNQWQKNPKDRKYKPQRCKNPSNQPTEQLGAVLLAIALKYETININLN